MQSLFLGISLLWVSSAWAANPAWESRLLKTDDKVEIHYLEGGPASSSLAPILFVPGYLMPADIFEFQLRHFGKNRRVLAMDPRSQGKSEKVAHGHHPARRARDIKAVADQAGLKNFVLAGWSLGALEVLSFCEQFGTENLKAVIFIDGDLSYEVAEGDAAREIAFLKAVSGFTQANRTEALRGFVRSIYASAPPAEHLERVTASVLGVSEDTSLALLINRIGFSVREGLGKIAAPALVVISDKNGNKEKVLADAKKLPKAEVRIMEHAGHALFVDKPDEFHGLVEEFLRRN